MKTLQPKPTKKWKKLSHKLRKTIKIPKWTSRNPIKVWNSWKHTKIGSVAPQKKRIWQKRSPRNSRNITFWPSRNIKRCFFASQWHSIIHFLAFRGKQKINIVIFFWHGNSKKMIFASQWIAKKLFFRFHREKENTFCHFFIAVEFKKWFFASRQNSKNYFLYFTRNRKMNSFIFWI